MKVVHSYVDKYNVIWKELLYSQYLSALLAKKHYGNISFVSTPEIIEVVSKLGIPYTECIEDIIVQEHSDTWSIGKLHCFKNIKEPFLHIDYDTFLFKKIDFKKYKKPFIFSHPDLAGSEGIVKNIDQGFSSIINNMYSFSNSKSRFTYDLNNTYTRLLFKLIDKIDRKVLENFDLNSIPNMNIVYVEDYKTFNKVAEEALTHYYSNKQAIDEEEFGPCYIEQLTLHQILRAKHKEYRAYSSKNKHTIFDYVPFSQLDEFNNVPSIDDVKFPFRGNLKTFCDCCDQPFEKDITIESKEQVKEFFDEDFNGFLHSTYLKWYDIFQAYTIHHLRKLIGDSKLKQIHNYYKSIHPDLNLPIKSGGEKLYEELTNFSFE